MKAASATLVVLLLTPAAFGDDGPAPNRPDEPLARVLSLAKAGEHLDGAALAWLNDHQCAACHTNYPYLMARPMLGDARAPALLKMRQFFEERVAGWDKGGKGAGLPEGSEGTTEVVATAATLAFHDAQSTGKLHPLTRQALARMWEVQRPDGSWDWNKHQLPPQEYDEYFGVVFAAVGVGHAPEGYAGSDAAKDGLARLRGYLTKHPAPDLHHRLWLLWASLKLDGLMTPAEREQTIKDLRALQRADGGWALPALGDWRRRDGRPNDKQAAGDGYATGLVVYVLRQAGVGKDDPAVQKGVKWLTANQRESGRWFVRSLSADRAHYITTAGTAYAVMALRACDVADK
jgi:squalene-hopene/tetraprenyl-beta-curcumene cyclase